MAKDDGQQERGDNVSGGGHLGGTRFGQQGTDAKDKPDNKDGSKGDKARPNDGQN